MGVVGGVLRPCNPKERILHRLISWRCSNCGRFFSSKKDCQLHEKKCTDRYYLAQNYKKRLKKYIGFIVSQGFDVSAETYSSNVVVVSVVDVARVRRHKQ